MTTPNAELAYRVLDHIDAHPRSHMQDVWVATTPCGTIACFAGWACLLNGDQVVYADEDEVETDDVFVDGAHAFIADRAAALLGIEPDGGGRTGYRLFEPRNNRETLGELVEEIFGPRPERAS